MGFPDIRTLVQRALSGNDDMEGADERVKEQAKAAAMTELLGLAQSFLDDLTAPLRDKRWPDRSISDLRNVVLFQFSRNLACFRGATVAELRAWLQTALENTCKNFHRYAAARRPAAGTLQSLDGRSVDASGDARTAEPAANELSVSRQVQLREAIARLDLLDRQILELRYHEGLTAKAIAKRVGRHERTVRRDLERLLTSLRGEVEPPR